jgi:PAS domain S-box-containing protein
LVSQTKALFESETLFPNMMETISPMAWTVTIKAQTSFFNQRWYKYTAMDNEQTKARGWYTVTHPDDLQHFSKSFHLIQVGSRSEWTGEVCYRRADGIFRWHLVSILPIRNENEEVQLWRGTAMDIHDLKLSKNKKTILSVRGLSFILFKSCNEAVRVVLSSWLAIKHNKKMPVCGLLRPSLSANRSLA